MQAIDAKSKNLREVSSAIKAALNGKAVTVKNADHVHGLAAGLKSGEVIINGNAGDYVAALNAGATIKITKDAGNYLADNMTAGTVIVEGNCGFGAVPYCYGGTAVIRGNAGDFTAVMNKGATIIIGGDVGDEVATYMLKGDLIVLGNAGENFANYLIRGNVYIQGEWKSIGHNTKVEPLTAEDKAKLAELFKTYNFNADPSHFKKIVTLSEKPFYH